MTGLRTSFLCAMLAAPSVQAQALIDVPSGQPVTFQDVIWEVEGEENIYRFRYIAPKIARDGGEIGFDQAEIDLRYLCEHSALVVLIKQNRDVDRIIISLSDRAIEFGKTDPEATQFFDSYTADGATCIWEGF